MRAVATLHVRNVPEGLYEALRARAQARGRSIGNEVIAILGENVARGVLPGGPYAQAGTLVRPREPRERFSEPSTRALAAASYEAHALGHDRIETEHVLLALLGEAPVAAALEALDLSAQEVREAVARNVEPGGSVQPGPRPFGEGAKRVLELALRESLAGGGGIIGPEHVVVALAADEGGVAGRVLRELGADSERLRTASAAGLRARGVVRSVAEYCAVALTGSAETWTEQLNARAEDGWRLLQIVSEGGEQRAVFRRDRNE